MSPGRAWLVLVAALAAVGCNPAVAAGASRSDVSSVQALGALDLCVARLDPQTDIGYEQIAARCPELGAQLDHAPWSAWLPADWKTSGNDLSVAGLRDLRSLITRELRTETHAQTPQVASLQPILRQLDLQSENHGVWSRFKTWLRDVFAPREQNPREGWLSRLLGEISLPEAFARLISWACLGAVVVLAVVIVANELRVAGLLRWRASSGNAEREPVPAQPRPVAWEDVQRAVPGERPRLLLQLIAARLVALGGLPPAEGLTVHELVRVARLPNPGDRDLLVDIALAAERLRFSGTEVPVDSIEVALAHGRALLDRLEARA